MANKHSAFDSFYTWPYDAKVQNVLLVDGESKASIHGIGTIFFSLNDFIIRLHNILYVPSLSTSLFSVKEHTTQYEKCSLKIEDNRFFLSFPIYVIKKKIVRKHNTSPFTLTPPLQYSPTFLHILPIQVSSTISQPSEHIYNQKT